MTPEGGRRPVIWPSAGPPGGRAASPASDTVCAPAVVPCQAPRTILTPVAVQRGKAGDRTAGLFHFPPVKRAGALPPPPTA
jgi:hypothetical protein